MHQNPAAGVVPWSPVGTTAGDIDARLANRIDILSRVGKFRRVMHHQDVTVDGSRSVPRRLKMTAKNLCFTDSIIVEKSIRGLRVRPVLAYQRNAVTWTRGQLLHQRSESFAQSFVTEHTVGNFAVNPRVRGFCIGNRRPPALSNSVVRHIAPCESGTRIICISSSRITCKNNLQIAKNKQKVVGN